MYIYIVTYSRKFTSWFSQMKITQLKGSYLCVFNSISIAISRRVISVIPLLTDFVWSVGCILILQVNIYSLATQKLVSCLSVQEPKSKGTLLLSAQYVMCSQLATS